VSPAPVTAGSSGGDDSGISLLGTLTRPPFVFFPILLLLALVGWLAYWLWSRRPGPPIGEVTILHRVPTIRDHEPLEPPPLPQPPAPPPIAYESPKPPKRSGKRPPPPPPPAGADVPPDLPEPTE
jgi:hypothetical protein